MKVLIAEDDPISRVLLQGHLPLQATVRALQETYTHLLQQNL